MDRRTALCIRAVDPRRGKIGRFYALDRSTGRIAWSYDVDPDREWRDDGVRVFSFHGGVFYVGTISGMLYAFDVNPTPPAGSRAIR